MTRSDIEAELNRVACEWRVPLIEIRGTGGRGRRGDAMVMAAKMTFIKRMIAAGVTCGHIAWALNIHRNAADRLCRKVRTREAEWWQ